MRKEGRDEEIGDEDGIKEAGTIQKTMHIMIQDQQ